MNRTRWTAVALIAATSCGCVTRSKYQQALDELASTRAQLSQLGDLAEGYGDELSAADGDRSRLEQQNAMLRSSNDEARRRIEDLMRKLEDMNSTVQIPGVDTISEPGAFTYRVDNAFLFDPGRADLKATGKKTIGEVAALLKQHDFKIEIAGHTDTDPVVRTKKDFPRGNIELGAERALSVWSELSSAGIPQPRMRVSSYGEYVPVDAADKSKNRRVEIRVLLADPSVVPN